MRRIALLALLLILTVTARAAGPEDQYLDIYNNILQGDNLQQNGHAAEAMAKYLEAQTALKALQHSNPSWNTEVVSFRLDYLAEQLQALQKAAPRTNAPPPQAAPAPPKAVTEIESLREQVRSLSAANAQLENKLKEALSVQPAAVSPDELAKAEQQNIALQKERDLLKVALEQSKTANPAAAPSPEADKTARQLADANQALAELKLRYSQETKTNQAETERLQQSLADAQKKVSADVAEMARLKDSLTDAQKQITTDTAEMEAIKASHGSEEMKNIVAERDKLKAELAARTRDLADAEAHRAAPSAAAATTDAQVDQLRARLAVLEAQAVPYTPEELAVLDKNPSRPPIDLPAAPEERKHTFHSMKDLPPGAGGLMQEAGHLMMERNYAAAIEKYREILHQDGNNVYVLAHLASAQFILGQLDESEKTLARSLALDPDDPPSLYLIGILRYRQRQFDGALNALSLSAKYNPTNADTQYYLGCVLAAKGMRSAAETALRKALEYDPKYADAHYSLACVYASETPPSMELARWHYRRSLDLGHEKSQELEKRLAPSP